MSNVPPFGEPIKPYLRGPGRAGIDIDDIRVVKRDACTVARNDPDIRLVPEKLAAGRAASSGIKLNRRHHATSTDKTMHYCRIVADPGADMHDMLTRPRCGAGYQRRM